MRSIGTEDKNYIILQIKIDREPRGHPCEYIQGVRNHWNHAMLVQENKLLTAHSVEILNSLCYLQWLVVT